jgi:DNA (cytosine-5)-methyltransferase 1
VFLVAYPQGDAGWLEHARQQPRRLCGDLAGGLLPTPTGRDDKGRNQRGERGSSGDLLPSAVALLPTPMAQEPGGTLEQYHARLKASDGRDATFAPLSMVAQLLPTPKTKNNENRQTEGYGGRNSNFYDILRDDRWGDYAPAIHRWETILGRPAPELTTLSSKGNLRLSPRFVEHMMGLPDGWVTNVPGVTRDQALRALGNGVVPHQAAAALRIMLTTEIAA